MGLLRTYPLLGFMVLAYALSSLLALPLALSNHGILGLHVADEFEVLVAFGPCIAAIMVLRATNNTAAIHEFWDSIKRWRIGPGGWLLVVGSPLIFLAIALAGIGLAQQTPPQLEMAPRPWPAILRYALDLVVITSLLQSLGEEPGWRGFLLPQLRKRFGPLAASGVLFPIWLFWHLPMVLARPEFGLGQFAGFALGILSATIWLTVIYEQTRSLLAAIVWHALVNLTRGIALAFSTSTFLAYGLTVTVSAAGLAVLLWRRSHTLNAEAT